MKALLLVVSVLVCANSAFAYDSSWYKSPGWSGEYPPGFQVTKRGVTVLGRKTVDETEVPSVKCVLKRNKYTPGKALPKAEYMEVSKIIPMTAKQDFTYATSAYNEQTQDFDDYTIDIKKGDIVEYLTYYAEGSFRARYKGKEFDAEQDLFDNVEYDLLADGTSPFINEQWINLSCMNKVNVWLNLKDLQINSKDGSEWIDGVESFFYNPYR